MKRCLFEQTAELVLAYSGAGPLSVVPGLGPGDMLRGDIEVWLAARSQETAKRQLDIPLVGQSRSLDRPR